MHSEISGTVDFYEKSDESCLKRLRSLVALLPEAQRAADSKIENKGSKSAKSPDTVTISSVSTVRRITTRAICFATIVDSNSVDRIQKPITARHWLTAYARIAAVGPPELSRVNGCKCAPKGRNPDGPASSIPTARTKPRVS